MTRWARGGNSKGKRELEATPWSKLQKSDSTYKNDNATETRDQPRRFKTRNKPSFEELVESNTPEMTKKKGKRRNAVRIKKRKGLLHTLMPDDDNDNDNRREETPDSDDSDNEKDAGVAELLQKIQADAKPHLTNEEADEMDNVIQKEKRREERRLKRIDKRQADMVCFKCRKQGHDMSNCPLLERDTSQGMGICFKCGSTEHSIHKCHIKLPAGVFPYAKCFICNEIGHLSKQCPDNPKGLYPNGGCCKWCSSVEHYKRDCPELKKKQGIEDLKLDRWIPGMKRSVDEEVHLTEEISVKKPKIVRKVVKF